MENKNRDIKMQNILENIAVIFQRQKKHFISRDGFEHIYKKEQISAQYSIKT